MTSTRLSGSSHVFEEASPSPLFQGLLWRIPDGRGVGPLLGDHRDFGRHLNPVAKRLIGHPTRRGNLDDPDVVEEDK